MKIIDILKTKSPTVSFEFFPPKNPELEHILFETMESLNNEKADFASVTFGAGGSSSDKTLSWTERIKKTCDITTMMHLTCVGFYKSQVDDLIATLKKMNIQNILALRGDRPEHIPAEQLPSDFIYASDLVEYIRKLTNDICIGVAGYPETHPESVSEANDIQMLKTKIDAGGNFIITQLFFDNEKFYRFRDKLSAAGIHVPVVAGIMPIISASQIVNFTKKCHASLPDKLLKSITECKENQVMELGINYAVNQCKDLIKNGIDGLHFYTLNRSVAAKSVLSKLRELNVLP